MESVQGKFLLLNKCLHDDILKRNYFIEAIDESR